MRRSSGVSPSCRPPSSVIAFKPRQVILLEQQLRSPSVSTSMANSKAEKPVQLTSEDEYAVVCSVAKWLESKGFSKVLKRFLSAAEIQDDDWKSKAHNLNEVFSKYLETWNSNNVYEEMEVKKQERQLVATAKTNGTASEEIEGKKKKRTKGHDAVIDTTESPEDTMKSNGKSEEDISCKTSDGLSHNDGKSTSSKGSDDVKAFAFETVDQSAKKQKDKKKKDKLASESSASDKKKTDVVPEVAEFKQKESLVQATENGVTKSKKASKKKKDMVKLESLDSDERQTEVVTESKQKDSLVEAAKNGVDESKKASKKRKRTDAEDKENQFGQNVGVEQSKPKNDKGLKEGKDGQAAEENFQAGQEGSQNVSGKQTNENTKVAPNDNGVDKSELKKLAKKQRKNSDEPKPVNPFQRVKIDDVKFVDKRLQDNSYWAKDGAETGYGAKAQEVLGQVKGRGFRHEKTKKKRGSYRGGQIDLQSHSIKFNYSDEE